MAKQELIQHLRSKKNDKITLADFKDSVVGLFDDFLKDPSLLKGEKQGKIARLRAKILIELRDL